MPEPQGLVYPPHEAAVRIETLNRTKTVMASATGTIVLARSGAATSRNSNHDRNPEQRVFIVTNWHVVSGRDPHSKRWLSKSLAPPTFLRLHMEDGGTGDPREIDVPLYEVDSDGDEARGIWLEHPFGRIVDVAAIDVTEASRGVTWRPVNLGDLSTNKTLEPFLDARIQTGDRLAVAGFPFGHASGRHAILMQSLLASDLDRGITVIDDSEVQHQVPGALLDLPAASEGCSGSMVYLYERQWTVATGARISWRDRIPIPIGLYSGRIDGRSVIGRLILLDDVAQAVVGERTESTFLGTLDGLEQRDRMPRKLPRMPRDAIH